MSLELFDLEFFFEGGIQIALLVVLGLMVAITVFTALLWQKGEEKMFFKFLGYLFGSIASLAGFLASLQLIFGTEMAFTLCFFIFLVALLVGVGIRIYRLILDKWIVKEEKV